jgi:predicted PurR-regulated permease PerM
VEKLIQWLDELDDLIYMVSLAGERFRRAIRSLLMTCFVLSIQIGGVLLALRHPPLALATAMLLFVFLLYHSVTSSHQPLEIA